MSNTSIIPAVSLSEDHRQAFQIRKLRQLNYGIGANANPQIPHRHNFQELIWINSGSGTQLIDGAEIAVAPLTFYLIAKGQVHHFRTARNINGIVLSFSEEFSLGGMGARTGRLFNSLFNNASSFPSLAIASDKVREIEDLLEILVREFEAPGDIGKETMLRALLQALLIKIVNNIDRNPLARDTSEHNPDHVFLNFLALLEQNFKSHHEVSFYTDALAITNRQLSSRTNRIVGKSAKRIIEERLALEAKRSFRFTEQSVKDVAYGLGYNDPSYFSKVFKRITGCSPSDFQSR